MFGVGWNGEEILIHYLENKVGVVDISNAQGMVMFQSPRAPQIYQSVGFCKIYDFPLFYFKVITFLSKIQNHPKKIVKFKFEFLKSKI